MLPFKFDTQLLIEGAGLCEDDIHAYIMDNIKGDSLLVIGDERLIRIHYHTNHPLAGAGILQYAGRNSRYYCGKHAAPGRGRTRLNRLYLLLYPLLYLPIARGCLLLSDRLRLAFLAPLSPVSFFKNTHEYGQFPYWGVQFFPFYRQENRQCFPCASVS